ncbi:MAG: type II toxin-antitoxin system HipA family toxin [Deltaproteobacteria bacterium]|nr:type II toxin-antitoxin system HipA family toxin [Deltaproteobacteria bacterium]MDQ3298801.1 type II toxin-antitoxin system HipA family toxin [Myxococcota bacterium]
MSGHELVVRWGDAEVGRVTLDADGRFRFRYAESWLDNRAASAISLSLPLRKDEYAEGPGHWFFANLLPEAGARQAVCARLGISETNDFALLRAIGGECAGALAIVDPARTIRDDDNAYELLEDHRLQQIVQRDGIVPLLVGGETTRLSLAGAQDKLPVARLDARLQLPLRGAPSTHILKLPHLRYAHLPVNEAFIMGLAAKIGFDVAKVELVATSPSCLLVERYDRRVSDDPWPAVRLHQEDLCQAFGLPGSQKYEQEGGPTLAGIIELVRASVSDPIVDVRRLLEWQAFNVVVGNADGHGKNLALLYASSRELRLAPFYDLLSTMQYDGIDRRLAMSVGGRRQAPELHRAQWETLAAEVQIRARVVIEIVADVADRCVAALPSWTDDFGAAYGEQPILQTLPTFIRSSAARVARQVQAK